MKRNVTVKCKVINRVHAVIDWQRASAVGVTSSHSLSAADASLWCCVC